METETGPHLTFARDRCMLSMSLIDNRSSRVGRVRGATGFAPTWIQCNITAHNGDIHMATNWADFGITWESGKVSRQHGEHRTDRIELPHPSQIPVPVDLDKLRAALGDELVKSYLNGTSMRVIAQDVSRRYIEATMEARKFYDVEELRGLVWDRLSGKRTTIGGGTREVKIRYLPNGKQFTGKTEVEFRAETIAVLLDMGVPVEAAKAAAAALVW